MSTMSSTAVLRPGGARPLRAFSGQLALALAVVGAVASCLPHEYRTHRDCDDSGCAGGGIGAGGAGSGGVADGGVGDPGVGNGGAAATGGSTQNTGGMPSPPAQFTLRIDGPTDGATVTLMVNVQN